MIQFLYCVFQLKANTPVLMCSVPGYDASSRVDESYVSIVYFR